MGVVSSRIFFFNCRVQRAFAEAAQLCDLGARDGPIDWVTSTHLGSPVVRAHDGGAAAKHDIIAHDSRRGGLFSP
jgi:hypothetical protein